MNEHGVVTESQQVEISIEAAREKVVLGKALEALLKNTHFKKLILNHYLKDYAVQVVKNKASYGQRGEDSQKFLDNEINAIGSFDQFLRFTSMEAQQAASSIAADENTLDELREEGL